MKPNRNGANLGLTFAILISCLMIFLLPAIFLLLAVGMAPTWVAFLAEKNNVGRLHTTAAMNLAGVLPFLQRIWREDGDMMAVMELLTNVFVWAIMYGAAATGVALLWAGPQIAAVYLDLKAARHSQQLEKQKKHLIDEWGDSLTDSPAGQKDAPKQKSAARTAGIGTV